jgi:peptide/nickel transport system permease protein
MFLPAMAIVLSATSVNLIGDGLRDALDPHLKS